MAGKLSAKVRDRAAARQALLLQRTLSALDSPDDTTRVAAVHRLCPCVADFDVGFGDCLLPKTQEPSPIVRGAENQVLNEELLEQFFAERGTPNGQRPARRRAKRR